MDFSEVVFFPKSKTFFLSHDLPVRRIWRKKPGGDTGGAGDPKWPEGYSTPQKVLPSINAGESYPAGPVWVQKGQSVIGQWVVNSCIDFSLIIIIITTIYHYYCILTSFLIIQLFLSQPTCFISILLPIPLGCRGREGVLLNF